MTAKKMTKKELMQSTMSVVTAASKLKIKTEVLNYHITRGAIQLLEGRIAKKDYEVIYQQKEDFFSLLTYMKWHRSERFDPTKKANRNKFIDYLEEENYFGIPLFDPEQFLFTFPDEDTLYIKKEDKEFLDFKTERFFIDFGLSEKEKIERLMANAEGCPITKKYLYQFLKTLDNGKNNIYTPSLTYFVDIMVNMDDVNHLSNEDVIEAINAAEFELTKDYVVAFCQYVKRQEDVPYQDVHRKKKEATRIPPYSRDKMVQLAYILFNKTFIEENHLIEKALDNSMIIETWMFLSMFFVCGWRAADMCRWIYPCLKEENIWGISLSSLKEDILTNKISDETYKNITEYCIQRIELANIYPGKTGINASPLRVAIGQSLRIFFGKLVLIAEWHHSQTGAGYMRNHRIPQYVNWVHLREIFGERMYEWTGRQNIKTRRLNKFYETSIEECARKNGQSPLVAYVIASLARNHANINTTAIYLDSGSFSGEDPETVIFMMMERGVASIYLHKMLQVGYPEIFDKMSAKEQTEFMKKIPVSAYELETISQVKSAVLTLKHVFSNGHTEQASDIIKAMYAVGQGQGRSKDNGVYCMKRALGCQCEYPRYESCLANMCPYHIFTYDGLPALLSVIKYYQDKYQKTKQNKYKSVLKNIIIPGFSDILNDVMRTMRKDEKETVKKRIKEGLGLE